MYLKAGKYYNEKWTYDSSLGVGLHFIGKPTNVDYFIEILQLFSCNPLATRRILSDLLEFGERKTTVMSSLNFEVIGDSLADLGITMKIIPPPEKVFSSDIDQIAFEIVNKDKQLSDFHSVENFSKDEINLINERVNIGKKHFISLGKSFGPFSDNFDFSKLNENPLIQKIKR